MISLAQRITESKVFKGTIILMILLVAVLAGLETNADIVAEHGVLLKTLDRIIIGIFIAEILLKFTATARDPLKFFRDGWNIFDLVVVLLCLIPGNSQFGIVLRLIRTLRLLRLVSALPKLQMLVGALIKSFASMGYVGLLLCLMLYIYAITGVHLFGSHDKENFGSLSQAFFTLFQIITLDDWRNLFEEAKGSNPFVAAFYFISFILLGTMIMLNLFIGIIMSSMEEMHSELEEYNAAKGTASEKDKLLANLSSMDEQVRALKTQLAELRKQLSKE
jgi:voltage-gated sodium channel